MGYITLINNTICQFCQDLKQVLHFHFAHLTFTASQPICACVTLIIFLLFSYPMVFAEFHPVPSAVQISPLWLFLLSTDFDSLLSSLHLWELKHVPVYSRYNHKRWCAAPDRAGTC